MEEEIKSIILKGTEYSGNKEPGKKRLSASSLDKPILQLYLDYKYGKQKQNKIEQSTIGSLVHLGLEQLFKDKDEYEVEVSLEHKLNNDWTITGSVDLLNKSKDIIIDWKVVKNSKKEEVLKGSIDNSYAKQLAVYKYLYYKRFNKIAKTYIGFFIKDASYFKPTPIESFYLSEINTYDIDFIEELLYDKTNELQDIISKEEVPEKCNDLFYYRPKGQQKKVSMSCLYFCNYSNNCPYNIDYFEKKNKDTMLLNSLEVIDNDEFDF